MTEILGDWGSGHAKNRHSRNPERKKESKWAVWEGKQNENCEGRSRETVASHTQQSKLNHKEMFYREKTSNVTQESIYIGSSGNKECGLLLRRPLLSLSQCLPLKINFGSELYTKVATFRKRIT